jgi:hypothetical protein
LNARSQLLRQSGAAEIYVSKPNRRRKVEMILDSHKIYFRDFQEWFDCAVARVRLPILVNPWPGLTSLRFSCLAVSLSCGSSLRVPNLLSNQTESPPYVGAAHPECLSDRLDAPSLADKLR